MSVLMKPLTIALYHVQPPISQYLLDEAKKNRKAYTQLEALLRKNDNAARDLLNEIKESMIRRGFDGERVQLETQQRRAGLDRAILNFAQENLYDALVLGQRDLSGLQKTFMGSVSNRILQQPASIPIWLVKGEVSSPEKILVAVDGSKDAYRAVDHLAFMLTGNLNAKLSFFHVRPRLKDVCTIDFEATQTEQLESVIAESDRQCMDRFFEHALGRLKEAGIGKDRIELIAVEPMLKIGKAIVEMAEQGNFGTLVAGRRGMTRTFLTGSVSEYLMDRLEDRALWIVQ